MEKLNVNNVSRATPALSETENRGLSVNANGKTTNSNRIESTHYYYMGKCMSIDVLILQLMLQRVFSRITPNMFIFLSSLLSSSKHYNSRIAV